MAVAATVIAASCAGTVVAGSAPAGATWCSTWAQRWPALTFYGVEAATDCNGGATYEVLDTCQQVKAWTGTQHVWVDNPNPAPSCNSNGDLLDFGHCYTGWWEYRTRTRIVKPTGVAGNYYTPSVSFSC
jgi:hypothetical protein